MTTEKLIMKRMESWLPDQQFDFEINGEEKIVEIRLLAFDSSLFVSFVMSLESEHGIRAYEYDDGAWPQSQVAWKLRVSIGATEYLARVVKLLAFGHERFTVTLNEIYPFTHDFRITINERLVRDPEFATALAAESSKSLRPPPGYLTWLDYAVDCMDTRSLEQQELWIDAPAERHWPEGTTREQMQQAVMAELAELRARANSDQFDAPSQILEKCETVPQAEIDAWTEKVAGDAPPLEGLRVVEQDRAFDILLRVPKRPPLPTELMPFKNRAAIEGADSCICYHCLNWFQSERVTNWTDDGETARCPICGVDAVLVNNTDSFISLDLLIDYWQEEFGIDGLPQEADVAEVRTQIEQIEKLKDQLVNGLPDFLSANYPLFVETLLFHWKGASMTDLAQWLFDRQSERLNFLLSGKEKELLKLVLEAEAGTCV